MTHYIAPYAEEFHDRLVELWLHAVSQTHDFLTEEDIGFYYDMMQNGALRSMEIWVCLNTEQEPIGFMGLDGSKIEMLFVDPRHHGQGTGTTLIRHAEQLKGRRLQVDVNEQNPKAHAFYKKYGFVQIGRSELDGSGKPFPLIHMQLPYPIR
ncbi:putative N-acetyltransferase YjaB [Paenibacillus sp. GM2FR]|uniref:acetyltransferase n=1 Tax=Paenibacillus TaxID=44249 RepID=UPI000C2715AB|nr:MULTISPECIES: acetyltransferase [Paenibacillus]MEC0309733.1 acetyltransferase [Paenibacillus lautus]PJN50640.1 putative N-acetyltransferase YjaB [Paenibacillus sp. GM2FR]